MFYYSFGVDILFLNNVCGRDLIISISKWGIEWSYYFGIFINI